MKCVKWSVSEKADRVRKEIRGEIEERQAVDIVVGLRIRGSIYECCNSESGLVSPRVCVPVGRTMGS